MALSPGLLGRLVAWQQPLFVERQLGETKAIVANHEVGLVEPQRARWVFRGRIRKRRTFDRVERAEVSPPQMELPVCPLHCFEQLAIALSHRADDKLRCEATRGLPAFPACSLHQLSCPHQPSPHTAGKLLLGCQLGKACLIWRFKVERNAIRKLDSTLNILE